MDAEQFFGRASQMLITRHLPAFPRNGEDRHWRWRISPDLHAVGVAAHGIATDADLPSTLFGYWVDVDVTEPPDGLNLEPTA